MYRPVSDIQICNQALLRLGVQRISAFSDNNPIAAACNVVYADCRDQLLREHPWNFATTRVKLSPEASTPLFGWTYQFILPSDCLKVLLVNDNLNPYKIEGNKILTDAKTVNLVYIKQETDTTKYDPSFQEALSLKIATNLAFALGRLDSGLITNLNNLYTQQLMIAKNLDGQEEPVDTLFLSDWEDARL